MGSALDAGSHVGHRERPFRLGVLSADAPPPSQPRRAPGPLARLPLLIAGFAALVTGVGAGLARLGVPVPAAAAAAAANHAPLMIGGFFGVVISLERAVAMGRSWAYLAPLLAGAGGVAAIAGATCAAATLLVAGSAVLVAVSADIVRRQTTLFNVTIAAGSAAWACGNVGWLLGAAPYEVVGWWLAFPILTIAGERLELSRFLPPSATAKRVFAALLVAFAIALVGGTRAWAQTLYAAALVALAAWLAKQDVARRTVRGVGLARFIAICLLSGYAWLAIGGGIAAASGGFAPGTRAYDASLHALALGFVFSMVFGHAPVIVPSVLRVTAPYHPALYVPLALLHGSLAIRLGADALGDARWTAIGGVLNALALAAFVAGTLASVLRGRRRAKRA